MSSQHASRVTPRVSVITRCYNYAHYLRECVGSILGQSFESFELIVVDDGSTDHTHDVIKGIRDPRVRYVRHAQNRGPGAALNTGVELSRGTYLACLDADDLMKPTNLSEKVGLLDNFGDVALVYGDAELIDQRGQTIGFVNRRTKAHLETAVVGNIFNQLLYNNFIVASSVMLRRDLAQKVGPFDVTLCQSEDWDMWLRLAARYRVGYVSGGLIKHRIHRASLQQQNLRSNRDLSAIKQVIDGAFERFPHEAAGQSYESVYRRHLFEILGHKSAVLPLSQLLDLYRSEMRSRPSNVLTSEHAAFVARLLLHVTLPKSLISRVRAYRLLRDWDEPSP